jgi:hypothetical protein
VLQQLQQESNVGCKLQESKKQLTWIEPLEKVIRTQAAAKVVRLAGR